MAKKDKFPRNEREEHDLNMLIFDYISAQKRKI